MRVLRGFGIFVGVLVILAVGLYGPVTLLAPLPDAKMSIRSVELDSAGTPPALPDVGATAVTESAKGPVLAQSGETESVPMAGIAKVLLTLVCSTPNPCLPMATAKPSPSRRATF